MKYNQNPNLRIISYVLSVLLLAIAFIILRYTSYVGKNVTLGTIDIINIFFCPSVTSKMSFSSIFIILLTTLGLRSSGSTSASYCREETLSFKLSLSE